MENSTFDRLLLLLIFMLLPVVHWLLGHVLRRRRAGEKTAGERAALQIPGSAPETAPAPVSNRIRERTATAPGLATPLRRSRAQILRRLLRNPREVKRGVGVMTVLGPGRAMEPPL